MAIYFFADLCNIADGSAGDVTYDASLAGNIACYLIDQFGGLT